MKKTINRCANMNHGKSNVSIRFCPMCGEALKSDARASCTEAQHASRRKDRNQFCCDCGKSLSKR